MNAKPTILTRATRYIEKHPGLTCAEIAHGIGIMHQDNGYPTLSSVLTKACAKGFLQRKQGDSLIRGQKAWRYYAARP